MSWFRRTSFFIACALGLAVACSSRHKEPEPAPPASTAPPPAPPPAPTTCASDSDCVPLNCCFAQTEHSCIPKARANCDKFAIECADAGMGYACACDKGACVGRWSMGGRPPGTGGPDAGLYAFQAPIAAGALSTAAVLDVIMKHGPDVRACHARAKKAIGLATFSWNVSKTGAVDRPAAMTSAGLDPKLTACLTKKIVGWRFPKAKGPTRVTYAFRFTRA